MANQGQGYHGHSDEHAKAGSQSMDSQNARDLTDDRAKGGKASASTNKFNQQGGDGHQRTGEEKDREDDH